MYDAAFTPTGPTILVSNNAWQQANPTGNLATNTSYRIRNILLTNQYLSWASGTPQGNAPSAATQPTPPTATAPSTNTIGMVGNSVETFVLPSYCWFIANASNSFEITPGEGL